MQQISESWFLKFYWIHLLVLNSFLDGDFNFLSVVSYHLQIVTVLLLPFQFEYLFIWLRRVLVVAHGIFDLCCGMWDLDPRPEVETSPPALRVQILSHWTTLLLLFFSFMMYVQKSLQSDYSVVTLFFWSGYVITHGMDEL